MFDNDPVDEMHRDAAKILAELDNRIAAMRQKIQAWNLTPLPDPDDDQEKHQLATVHPIHERRCKR